MNKQVLYGRSDRGVVVARCLLALTTEGTIVTFHPYCHDKALDFEAVAEDFVHKIAKEMSTVVVAQGIVPTLVAHDWYDDGPIDLTGRSVLESQRFWRELEEMPLEKVLETLQRAVDPLALDALTLPRFIYHSVFTERPELITVVYPLLIHDERIAPEVLLRAAQLLVAAGHDRDAERFLPRLMHYALCGHRRGSYVVNDVLDVMLEVSPSKALLLLKKTRGRGVRSLAQETDTRRLVVAGKANQQLHRPKKAAELFNRAIKHACCAEHGQEAQMLLDQLQRTLGAQ